MSRSSMLFQPITLGTMQLKQRVVLAPLTRTRATRLTHVPVLPLVKDYYEQRSRTPGTFLITEGTYIAAKAGGFLNVPGIWNPEQISAWKEIVDAVHANGSFIYLQLWALGRGARPEDLDAESLTMVAPSPIPLSYRQQKIPKEMSVEEIHEYIEFYAQAAKNAVYGAGFDGVELNAVNGFLLDQFLQDVTNQRTDAYGGSVESRSRFVLEAMDAITKAIGPERTALRVSPWSTWQEMGMKNPIPQYTHLISSLKAAHPALAYLHIIEPRVNGTLEYVENPNSLVEVEESNDFIREIWSPKRLIVAGGFTRETAMRTANETGALVAFGRHYIANPDLPFRLRRNIPLNKYDRTTFYVPGDKEGAAVGYTDYPFTST